MCNVPKLDQPPSSQVSGESKPNRRLWLTAAIGCGVIGVGVALRDFHCWGRLEANCYSDTIYFFYEPLRKYLEEHEGILPPADELVYIASHNGKWVPTCPESHQSYRWNLTLAGHHISDLEGQVLAWCPPGSHGRYTAAMLVERGELGPRLLTTSYLRKRLAEYRIEYA